MKNRSSFACLLFFLTMILNMLFCDLCSAGIALSHEPDREEAGKVAAASNNPGSGEPQDFLYLIDLSGFDRAALDGLKSMKEITRWLEIGDHLAAVGSSELGILLGRSSRRFMLVDDRFDPSLYKILRSRDPEKIKQAKDLARIIVEAGGFYLVRLIDGKQTDLFSLEDFRFAIDEFPQGSVIVYGRYREAPAEQGTTAWDPEIQIVVDDLDAQYLAARTEELTQIDSRFCLSPNFFRATNYLVNEYTGLGLPVELDPFVVLSKTVNNVIAEIEGLLYPDDIYIACGHYDTFMSYPGADDNASGAAATLAMAKVFTQHPPLSTIRFVDFAAEEEGLVGSTHYVSDLLSKKDHDRVRGVINMDMIAYENRTDGKIDVLLEGRERLSQPLMDDLTESARDYTTLEPPFVSYNPYGSDHMPFLNKNIPALLTIENEDGANPNYHTPSDTYGTLNEALHREIAKMNLATLAKLSGVRDPDDVDLPGTPGSLSIAAATHSSVELTWIAPGDDGNAGKAAAYDVRYSSSPIQNETNFAIATKAEGEQKPSPSGTLERFTVMGLPSGTKYYFSVKATDDNLNGSALPSTSPRATTDPVVLRFYDDIESGTGAWTSDSEWHRETFRNRTPGGSYSWKCGAGGSSYYGNNLNASLVSPYVTLGPGSVLQFWHRMLAKDKDDAQSYDGGIVEIQQSGSPDWIQITPAGGYNYLSAGGPFPPGTPLFSGNISWREEDFDLSSYSGDARFRFRFGSDASSAWEGWYIDDVLIVSQVIPGNVPDGTGEEQPLLIRKSGENLHYSWGPVPGADYYNLYRGTIDSIANGVYDHVCLQRQIPGMEIELADESGDHYYLVSAQNHAGEGPLGRDSQGNSIPINDANRCVP